MSRLNKCSFPQYKVYLLKAGIATSILQRICMATEAVPFGGLHFSTLKCCSIVAYQLGCNIFYYRYHLKTSVSPERGSGNTKWVSLRESQPKCPICPQTGYEFLPCTVHRPFISTDANTFLLKNCF